MELTQDRMMQFMTADRKIPFGAVKGIRRKVKKSFEGFDRRHVGSMKGHDFNAIATCAGFPLFVQGLLIDKHHA